MSRTQKMLLNLKHGTEVHFMGHRVKVLSCCRAKWGSVTFDTRRGVRYVYASL